MPVSFTLKAKPTTEKTLFFIGSKVPAELPENITTENIKSLNAKPKEWQSFRSVHEDGTTIVRIPPFSEKTNRAEYFRKCGSDLWAYLKSQDLEALYCVAGEEADVLALCEGIALRDYRFETYKQHKASYHLKKMGIAKSIISSKALKELSGKIEGICLARDLVNEPANILTATEFGKRIEKAGKTAGFKVEVLGKAKIKSLKMGGLLSVNQGSTKPPTFSVMEYKPKNAKNKKPLVLVGKGIVYDTGGLSLKPTANSMDMMKCDMGGGAAVVGAIYAAARAQLPVHVVGLIPATDNQPGPDAYGPGDVITMMDGTRVEVMNTDAEGRLVLADALAYAKRYDPELTVDLATLTGSSMRALGYYAASMMGTANEKARNKLIEAGHNSFERVVEFPLWKDYAYDLESDIADTRNVGTSPMAGAIIAGKFLERFANFPWIHIDIAGPAFLPGSRGYLPKGGTGFGVNLLFHFLKDYK